MSTDLVSSWVNPFSVVFCDEKPNVAKSQSRWEDAQSCDSRVSVCVCLSVCVHIRFPVHALIYVHVNSDKYFQEEELTPPIPWEV